MMLYNLLLRLEEKKIYCVLISVGAIPFRVNTDFNIYKTYLKESQRDKRKKQVAYNVSRIFKCSEVTVYRAIKNMKQEVNFSEEISFN